ncbi:uncharacterized protein [Drosophila takahashii]|uniref:uncharacterized protein n=1 Tax=Drosophila takahashii TaxID=29030 RepID=UPI001CF8A318|nr:uncharacterized protein LOC108061278 [Drosophila takahashii]
MSPKFALAILLFSCVLLGIASAQQYRYPQTYNRPKVAARNLDGGGPLPPNFPPPAGGPLDGGAVNPDCMPNQLASNTVDNKKPRSRH